MTGTSPTLGRRLAGDGRAVFASALIVLLVIMALAGPLLWPRDPSAQWFSRASLAPVAATSAVVVDHGPWSGPGLSLDQPMALAANTERVRLGWPAIDGAAAYRLFRAEAAMPEPGLPLTAVSRTFYEDRLLLSATPYVYTVQAVDARGSLLWQGRLPVTPEAAISRFEAELSGLLPEGSSVTRVELPAHPLGTDALGRDMLARIIQGARASLFVGFFAPLCFIGFGALYGALAALAGGRTDNVMMRVSDFVMALPFLLFMILLRVALGVGPGESGLLTILLAMLLLSWPSTARLVRGQVLELRSRPFMDAARLNGAGTGRLLFRHLLPNVMPVLLVAFSFAVPQAIFTEAFLSFIGMGVVAPVASWGSLCNEGIKHMVSTPHQLFFPALFISLSVLSFNLLGDSLRDATDVRYRGQLT